MQASATRKHLVVHGVEGWGHLRPLSNFCAKLVKMSPVTITFLTTRNFVEKVKAEIQRGLDPGDEQLSEHIRVVSFSESGGFASDEVIARFKAVWTKITTETAAVCEKTGIVYPPLDKPGTIIIDFFASRATQTIRDVSGREVKIYGFHPGLAYDALRPWAPEKFGGRGNMRLQAEELARRSGKSFEDSAMEILRADSGEVVRLPGFPPMYDYEWHPQDTPFLSPEVSAMLVRVHEGTELHDGILSFSSEAYEAEAIDTLRRWYGETSRPVYVCGPLVPTESQAIAHAGNVSSDASAITVFLDETVKTTGKQSLLFISLGSIFWPAKSPEQMWALLDVVMELQIPFILSHASVAAVIPDAVRDKVQAYGKGLLSAWTPQQMILEHPATGWFLGHGGHNGVLEAITAGVPLIVWPFGGDQPANAVVIADVLKIGYELVEVRTGLGLRPTLRRGGRAPAGTLDALRAEVRATLRDAFGRDGAEKRRALETVRKAMLGGWEEGGASRREVQAFLDTIL